MTGGLQNSAAPRRKRLAVARFWHEGNAFGPLPADSAAFERCEWRRGAAALAAARGTATELAAVVEFSDRQPQWDVVALRCASALPAGPIDEAVFERYAGELGDDLMTAVHRAKQYTTAAIRSSPGLGHGRGPVNFHCA